MPFGKTLAKNVPADEPKEPAKPKDPQEGKGVEGGWDNVWGALAARDGCLTNINPDIYGEVTPDGCALMFKNLPVFARLDADSVIYDLGSGYGKFTIWCGTVAKKKSVGIENNAERAQVASDAFSLAKSKGHLTEEEAARIKLIEGDAFADGAFADATHIYMCNVGYDEDMHLKLLEQVPKCRNLKVIITITSLHDGNRAVPPEKLEEAGLAFMGDTVAPTTWDPESKVHFYCTAKGQEPENLRLKLVDAEKFASLVNDVYSQFEMEKK
mmetsp:Transcript_905/g.1526  ORF Transcript_905/g.1526 Transcript_905/m.1526 type:complete len:269 (-) Transcript_905:80-886(-)